MGRPLFLVGGVVFHALGVVMALYTGAELNLPILLWGQLAITAVQLMTHYSNEYFDSEADKCNPNPTRWAGGSRVLPRGLLPPGVALISAIVFGLAAIVAAVTLRFLYQTGPLTLPMVLLAQFLGWGYSSPPFWFKDRGLGELTIAFVVPGLTPMLGFYLQTGGLAWLPLVAVLPLCLIQVAMSLSVNFPDATGDEDAGKRTLVVRLGRENAARLYNSLLVASYALLPILALLGLPFQIAGAASLSAPLAVWLIWQMRRGVWAMPSEWDNLAFWSTGLLVGTAGLEVSAFLGAWCC
jgi:1,4-dihydroxy-2-naphthoate octaprenyltransferase